MEDKDIQAEINSRKDRAKKILNDEDAFRSFIDDVENKFNKLFRKSTFVSKSLRQIKEYVPLLVSLVKSYFRKEYNHIPTGTIIGVVGALIYFLSPIDIVFDFIPGLGNVDDATVLLFCIMSMKSDLDDYKKWKELNADVIDVEVNKI